MSARDRWQWIDGAACTAPDVDPDVFFPHEGDTEPNRKAQERAKEICRGCVVRDTCLHTVFHDIAGPKQEGVWGGATYEDREDVRREVAKRKRRVKKTEE